MRRARRMAKVTKRAILLVAGAGTILFTPLDLDSAKAPDTEPSPPGNAVAPSSTDAGEIMRAVHGRRRASRVSGRIQMTLRDSGGFERTRVLETRTLELQGLRHTLMIFESPADVRNTGFLSRDYDDGKTDDEQWLYMPGLHRSTRIVSSARAGSFMGSDFSYADMTLADPADYEHELLEPEVEVDGALCWLIESRPRQKKTREETGYMRKHTWVSKKNLMAVQTKAWVIEGKKIKYIKLSDIRYQDGVWAAHKLVARTVKGRAVESESVIRYLGLNLNDPSVAEADFSMQRLQRGL